MAIFRPRCFAARCLAWYLEQNHFERPFFFLVSFCFLGVAGVPDARARVSEVRRLCGALAQFRCKFLLGVNCVGPLCNAFRVPFGDLVSPVCLIRSFRAGAYSLSIRARLQSFGVALSFVCELAALWPPRSRLTLCLQRAEEPISRHAGWREMFSTRAQIGIVFVPVASRLID